jgi:hypothetical protein
VDLAGIFVIQVHWREVALADKCKFWSIPLCSVQRRSTNREWARGGKVVKKTVPPGPNNPLDGYWIGLSFPSYGIHGTNAPLYLAVVIVMRRLDQLN